MYQLKNNVLIKFPYNITKFIGYLIKLKNILVIHVLMNYLY